MWAIVWKDLIIEARRRESFLSLLALGLLTLIIFRFALNVESEEALKLAPGLLWAAILFSGAAGLARAFSVEREHGCMAGLLMSPIDRGTIFFAKFTGNLFWMVGFNLVLVPAFCLFFEVSLADRILPLSAVLLAGSVGVSAAATLFAPAALGTRSRELMLPLLVLPLEAPLLLSAVRCTELVLGGAALDSLGAWGALLVGFDIVMLTSGWLLFEFVAVD